MERRAREDDTGDLADRLQSMAVHLVRYARRDDRLAGLSAARMSALSVLVFGGPQTLGALAAAEQVTAPTMSRLVDALLIDGYVTRERSADDGRAVRITATAKAVDALEAGRNRRVARVQALLAQMTSEDQASIAAATALLEAALEPHLAPPEE